MIGAALLALTLTVLAADTKAPLADEDVVRMIAAGRSEAEVLRTIAERDVRFDLSEEMIDELRVAGVPEPVLAAMRARQTELHPPAPVPKPALPKEEALTTVSVRFVAAHNDAAAIWIPGIADDALAKILQLGRQTKDRRIDGVALFVACTTPEHVPDQWRTRSPLGRDFVSIPRHEMLAFQASTERVKEKDVPKGERGAAQQLERGVEPEWLRLELPAELAIALRRGVPHDLVVGIAVLVGENYLAIDLDTRKDVGAEGLADGLRVSVGRHEKRSQAIGVRFVPTP